MLKNENKNKNYLRAIDANLNRLKEGIRVAEDILRYIHNNKKLSKKLKKLRHKSKIKQYKTLIITRDIKNDVLKKTKKNDLKRKDTYHIFIANLKRAQEASRVLEELGKLISKNTSEKFKKIRYKLYKIEKQSLI